MFKNLFFAGILKVNEENSRIRFQDPDPDPNPDPLVRGMDPRIRIRIHPKITWIRNTAYIEEIETSLLTLIGVSLVLWRGKADSPLSNPCFMTLPSDFTTSEFPIFIYFSFQNFC